MVPEKKDIAARVIDGFQRTTGLKAVLHYAHMDKTKYLDGMVRVEHMDMHWIFAVETKAKVNRTTAALVKDTQKKVREDLILITRYVSPPMADFMKGIGLFFMDAAGNTYIEKPPLHVFIKGNKLPEDMKAVTPRRILKTAGLKVIFTLLNNPDMVNLSYRRIADITGVALGTIGWIFKDLKEMGFMFDIGNHKRRIVNTRMLLKRWAEAYPDQLRPKIVIGRFRSDIPHWWEDVNIKNYDASWGGEVAAAKLTKRLKPQRVSIYANKPPGKLIIEKKLRKAKDGEIEILKPFWQFDHDFTDQGITPPLLIYADLMASGDSRNIETAGIIYDEYLAQHDRQAG